MRHSQEVGGIPHVAECGDLTHDIVRGFAVKYGLDESLATTPEIAWNWVFDGIRHGAPYLDVDARFELAAWCFRAIRDRMSRAREGGAYGVH